MVNQLLGLNTLPLIPEYFYSFRANESHLQNQFRGSGWREEGSDRLHKQKFYGTINNLFNKPLQGDNASLF